MFRVICMSKDLNNLLVKWIITVMDKEFSVLSFVAHRFVEIVYKQ
jgi:hypothetical protein